jgi:hypothetical protein
MVCVRVQAESRAERERVDADLRAQTQAELAQREAASMKAGKGQGCMFVCDVTILVCAQSMPLPHSRKSERASRRRVQSRSQPRPRRSKRSAKCTTPSQVSVLRDELRERHARAQNARRRSSRRASSKT